MIATAWASPGSQYFEDPHVRDRCIQALRDFRAAIYNPSQPEFGNWYTWEIAATQAYGDAITLLLDHVTEQDVIEYCDSIDYYVPDPWEQYPEERGREISEGANRVDLCRAVIIRSIVGQDPDRLAHAVAGLSDVWQYVQQGDGFYADGSFLQHGTIGYTGTYGLVLLDGLAKMFALLADTAHDVTDPSRVNLTSAVDASFAPLVHEGQMMDAVRGRAIAVEAGSSVYYGNLAIESILRLSAAVDAHSAARWRGLCQAWIEDNSYSSILESETASAINTAMIPRLALVTDLLSSDVEPVRYPVGGHFFPSMDRMVYRGQDWAICVAMCSSRIAWYECGNGENDYGSLTSQGMTYLYLPWADGHFEDQFWSTCDLQGLPGITVDTTVLPPRVEGEWANATPDNEWTGGAVLEDVAIAGQHLIAPGETGLAARKTWMFLPNAIIALGSDIATGTEAEVKTVIEHRNLGQASGTLLLEGENVGLQEVTSTASTWAHLEDVGGYLFLSGQQIRAVQAEREGSWRRNNDNGSTTIQRRHFATIESVHSAERTTYAYAILPGVDVESTQAAVDDPPAEVINNDSVVQAVRAGRVLGANFWQAGRVQNLSMEQPASVIRSRSGRSIGFSVSDPTHAQDELSFVMNGDPNLRPDGSDRVSVSQERGAVRVTVDTRGLAGRPVSFTLRR